MEQQRFDVETNIAPPMRFAITLVSKTGIVVYVTQAAFGPQGESRSPVDELDRVARRVASALEDV